MAAAAAGKLLMLLLPAFSLAQESCMQEVLLLRQQMEVEKVAMQSKLDEMAASIEKLEAEAAQALEHLLLSFQSPFHSTFLLLEVMDE